MKADRPAIGRLYGVGVGPGDPELITLKARRILSRVPVIFAPQKDDRGRGYASGIIGDIISGSEQKVIELVFPMGKDTAQLADFWRQAADSMWHHLSRGLDCAFVTEGDPFLYGTFVYAFETLKQSHPEVSIEVIPGVSSINATAARALVPLASGGRRIAILPATYEDKDIRETLEHFDTVVFLKVHSVFDRVLGILQELNLVDRCVYVARCTTEDEEIITDITELQGKKLDYFSILIMRR